MTAGAMRVIADADVCIGAGQCALVAPGVFDQRVEDGIVEVLTDEPPAGLTDAVRRAVLLCPSGAIRVAK